MPDTPEVAGSISPKLSFDEPPPEPDETELADAEIRGDISLGQLAREALDAGEDLSIPGHAETWHDTPPDGDG